MPAPPIPTKCRRRPDHGPLTAAARLAAGRREHLAGDLLGRVRPGEPAGGAGHRGQPRPVGEQAADRRRQPGPVELAVGDHHRRAGLLEVPRVGALVIGGGVRIGDQHRRPAVGGDLEHRAAGAGDDEVAGGERLAEVADVAAQVVVRARRACSEARSRSPAACRTRNRAPGERLDRGVVDRARAERAAEHEHAGLRRVDPEPPARRGPVGGRRRHRAPGDPVARRLAAVDRERQAHPPRRGARAAGWSARGGCRPPSARAARRLQDRGQADRAGDVPARAEHGVGPELAEQPAARARSAAASTATAPQRRRAAGGGAAAARSSACSS